MSPLLKKKDTMYTNGMRAQQVSSCSNRGRRGECRVRVEGGGREKGEKEEERREEGREGGREKGGRYKGGREKGGRGVHEGRCYSRCITTPTHQKQANSCNVLSSVSSGLKGSKYHHSDEYGDHRTDKVPQEGGHPVAAHVHTTHKLEVLSLGRRTVM